MIDFFNGREHGTIHCSIIWPDGSHPNAVTLHARTGGGACTAKQASKQVSRVQWQLARRSIDGAHAHAAIVFVFPVPVPVHGHGPVFLHTRSYACRAANKQVRPHAGGRRGGGAPRSRAPRSWMSCRRGARRSLLA